MHPLINAACHHNVYYKQVCIHLIALNTMHVDITSVDVSGAASPPVVVTTREVSVACDPRQKSEACYDILLFRVHVMESRQGATWGVGCVCVCVYGWVCLCRCV
jgi:hypothetical protein